MTIELSRTYLNMMWVDKYKPTRVSDIIGNESAINDIIEWLDKFKKKDETIKHAILLAGDPGTGKTTCARLVAEECGFVVHEFNASDQRSKKSLHSIMLELAQSSDVMQFFKAAPKTKPKRHVIVMEEVDGMASGDYGGITELTNIINPKSRDKWLCPIICTTNLDKISKLKNLMRHSHLFNFEYPSFDNMKTLLDKVVKNENLKISKESCKKIIDHSQQDYRRLLYLMEILCVPLINKNDNKNVQLTISDDDVENMLSTFGNKYKSLAIDLAMNELLSYLEPPYRQLNLDRITDICNMDYYLIPASIHENYPLWFPKKRKKKIKTEKGKIDVDLEDIDLKRENKTENTQSLLRLQNQETNDENKVLQCVKSIINNISNKDFQYPLHSTSTYESLVQDDMALFTVGFPISLMKKYLQDSKTKKANLKLVYPKQFSNIVSLTSQMKVFKELRLLLPALSGRDQLLHIKERITNMLFADDYDNLVKLLYELTLLPEQVPILMRVRMINEDHLKTKKNWTLKTQNQVCKLFQKYNDEMFSLHQLQPIETIQESRKIIKYDCV